jgi:hypothetical protein
MADYCTRQEVKNQPDITGATHDTVIDAMITAASRAFDNYCRRPDGFVALALAAATYRLYAGSGTAVQRIDECTAVTEVNVKDSPTDSTYTAWVPGDYIAASGDQESPDFNHTPYTMLLADPTGDYSFFTSGRFAFRKGFRPDPDVPYRGVPTVQVKGRWGYAATVPDAIKQACIIQVCRWMTRGGSSWADSVGSAETGTMMFRQELDPDIKFILSSGRYIRPAVG